ncbi:plasmid partitioning protein RepB [Brucella sp. NBRC 12950]|uniref:plasmid partitioning protein RepB n=1 Tax=Brucella sp. NBRC 12950 TaxID=2994518 RepID=UPI00249FF66D|nr:plasmid partitioning protein RepB [Brucella sp. NBRC 12950]GLU29124.1 plasmid partitioning protein RepB [Brucella sp. NBRC 12950]
MFTSGAKQIPNQHDAGQGSSHNSEAIVELDVGSIVPSHIRDRFDETYDLDAIAEITQSMKLRGQLVPGLVRPILGQPDRFQIVYGRRRLAAAKLIGIRFKAAIRELSNEEAVIIQGEENSAREDLSFIEKWLFAVEQQMSGYKRETICASLSTGKSHVSEMIKIGSLIDRKVLFAIGRAPGIGRGRWEMLCHLWHSKGDILSYRSILDSAEFKALSSDQRFRLILQRLGGTVLNSKVKRKIPAKVSTQSRWSAFDQTIDVSIKKTMTQAVLSMGSAEGVRFADYIAGRFDELYDDFRKREKK